MVLGGAFLCVAGAEALFADLGHFGPGPIWLSWGLVVFPALILPHVDWKKGCPEWGFFPICH